MIDGLRTRLRSGPRPCVYRKSDDKMATKEKRFPSSMSEKQQNGTVEPTGSDRTSVSVDDSETWVEAKRYTVYKVVVRTTDKAYFVFRR